MRRANTRTKQVAVADGSELRRVDRAVARLRKQNMELREQQESVRRRPARPVP